MGIKYYKGQQNLFEDIPCEETRLNKLEEKLRELYGSKNLCFLLGSGCSSGAIKTMGVTFKDSKDKIEDIIEEKELNPRFIDYIEENDSNIEEYLNWLNKGMDFLKDDSDEQDGCKSIFEQVKEDLINSITIDYFNDGDKDKEIKETLNKYITFYNQIFNCREYKPNNPINVFTTNYDLFNEIALEKSNVNYINGFTGSVVREFSPNVYNLRIVDEEDKYKDQWNPIRKFVRLYKLHGSIDWYYEEYKKDYKIVQKSYQANLGNNFHNVIIYPTLEKHFETLMSPYSELFREMDIVLQKPDTTLIVIGYGFGDEHINNLIQQSLKDHTFNLIVFSGKDGEKFFDKNKSENFTYITGEIEQEDLDPVTPSNNKIHYFENILKLLKTDEEFLRGNCND